MLLLLANLVLISPRLTLAGADKDNGVAHRVAALEAKVASLQQQINAIQLKPGPQGPAGPQGDKGDTGAAGPAGSQGPAGTPTDMSRVMALETKTAPLSVSDTNLLITGKNVLILDGTGSTNSTSGLGNLTVGYNGTRVPFEPDIRTGTHNLIVGDENNYSSFGGLVAGRINTISGAYATVSGGLANNLCASVSGGEGNTASSRSASVSGGNRVIQSNTYGWSAGGAGAFHSP